MKAILVSLGCLLLAACTANRAYRDADSRPWHAPQPPFTKGKQLPQYEPYVAGANPAHSFDLSFIEFDEKGDYWDRRQLGWTVQGIKRACQKENVVLLVYVHGWQNDASDLRGHDPEKFRCLLQRVAESQGASRRVYGVYLAWRGKSVPGGDGWFPPKSVPDVVSQGLFVVPHELSFFGRKDAATRVAGMPMTEAILESVSASRTGVRASGHLSKSIVIGHSFGALVVEKAMADTLASEVIASDSGGGKNFPAPADLVVLLNSAGESIYAKEMQDFLRRRHPVSGGSSEISPRRPLLVAVTSEKDSATGAIFPIGASVGSVNGLFRRYDWDTRFGNSSAGVEQREYFTTTAGHNGHLITHSAIPESAPIKATLTDQGACSPAMLSGVEANLREPLTGPNGEMRFVTISPEGKRVYWQLRDEVPSKWRTPYWIVKVPGEISSGHSDIFNENSLALLARIFRLSNPEAGPGLQMTGGARTMHLVEPGSAAAGY